MLDPLILKSISIGFGLLFREAQPGQAICGERYEFCESVSIFERNAQHGTHGGSGNSQREVGNYVHAARTGDAIQFSVHKGFDCGSNGC